MAPEMQAQIADTERDVYFADPETQASLASVSSKMLERQRGRGQTESVAVGLEDPAERAEIIEAAEDNVADSYYTQTLAEVTYNYGTDELWQKSQSYTALDHLQIVLDDVEGKVQSGHKADDADTQDVQSLYDETRTSKSSQPISETFPEQDPRGEMSGPVESLLVETIETFGTADQAEETPQPESEVAIETILHPEKTNWGKLAHEAAGLVADIEIALGSSHSDTVQTARYFLEQIDTAIDTKPINAKSAQAALENLKSIHQEREAYAKTEDDGLPNVFELQPDKAEARREEILAPRRAKLTPEDLDAGHVGKIEINTEAVTPQQMFEELQSLESDFSDASFTDELPESLVDQPDSEAVVDNVLAANTEVFETKQSPSAESVEPTERPEPYLDDVALERQQTQVERREKERIHAVIEKVEHGGGGFNFLNKFFGDGVSPVAELADVPFAQFADLLRLQKPEFERFTVHEYRGKEIDYGALQKWGAYEDELNSAARQHARQYGGTPTTKQVVELAITEGLI